VNRSRAQQLAATKNRWLNPVQLRTQLISRLNWSVILQRLSQFIKLSLEDLTPGSLSIAMDAICSHLRNAGRLAKELILAGPIRCVDGPLRGQ
jgi:hypothetical protein